MGTSRERQRLKAPTLSKVRCLSAAAQIRDMASKYPEFAGRRVGNQAIWEGRFRPSPSCATYLVRIEALSGQRPWVSVLDPTLRMERDQWFETHRFSHGGLCLHLREEWRPNQFIADTIVPWTAFWLINYEYWLASGEWLGGGQHPEPRERK
jgi:hypothetical protein